VKLRTLILLLTLLFALASFSSAIIYLPTSTPYSIYNVGPNGFSRFFAETTPIYSIREASKLPGNTTLITLSNNLDDIDTLRNYVSNGGTLIILYNINHTKNYAEDLFEGINVENVTVVDNTYHVGSGSTPYAWVSMGQHLWRIVLHKPLPIRIVGNGWVPLALTSPFSFKDTNGNGARDPFETEGQYTVGACKSIGDGKVCVITSPSLISNKLLSYNMDFIRSLGKEAFLYVGSTNLALVDRLKLAIHMGFSRIAFTFSLAILAFILGAYFRNVRPTRTYYVALTLSSLALLTEAIISRDWGSLVLLSLAYASAVLKKSSLALASLASILIYLGLSPQFLLLALPLYILYPLTLVLDEKKPPSGVLGSSTEFSFKMACAFTVTSIMYPTSIPSLTTFLLSILAVTLIWYVRLGSVKVKMPLSFEVTLGRRSSFPVILNSRGKIRVYGRVSSNTVVEEFSEGVNVLNIPYYSRRLGVFKENVEVVIEDVKGLASRKHVVNVTFKVVPSVSVLLKKVASWLGGLVEHVGGFIERKIAEAGLMPGKEPGISSGEGVGVAGGKLPRKAVITFEEGFLRKSRRGVYDGVREYMAGDDLRDIHWKKTASRKQLIVKTYSSGSGRRGGAGAGGAALIADLEASNEYELDRLAYDLVSYLAYGARYAPKMKTMVYLTLPSGAVMVFTGNFKTILAGIIYLFRKGLIRVDSDYLSQSIPLSIVEMENIVSRAEENKLLRTMLSANTPYIRDVVEALKEAGIAPPSAYILLYGSPTSFKHSYLDYVLLSMGYKRLVRREAS